MAVNGFDLELILVSVFGMNAPCLFTRLRVLRRSCSLLLPLPFLLSGAVRQIQQLATHDVSKNVVRTPTLGLRNLLNLCVDCCDLGRAHPAVIFLCQLFRGRYREVLWNLLTYDSHHFAWKVRQEAALFIHDLATYGETDLATHLHVEAFDVYQRLGYWRKREPSKMYERLRAKVDAELRFKMIQFNAALVAADLQWLVGTVSENRRNPRMFSHHRVPSTPTAPPEIGSPTDIGDFRIWETRFGLNISHLLS